MNIKNILINSVWFGVIPKISTIINVLLLPIITPYLSPFDYGVWGIISSYSSIVLAICTLGLHMHLTNGYYEYKNKFNIFWGHIFFLLLISSVIFSIGLIILYLFVLQEIELNKRIIVAIIAAFPILFNSNSLLASHLYPLRSCPKPLVLRNLFSSIMGLLTLFIVIYYFNLGYLGFVSSAAVSAFISFFIYINPLWIKEKIFPRIDRNFTRIKKLLTISFPVIPHSLGFILLSSSSRIVMSWYNVSTEDIGYFSNGYMMGDYITIITMSVVTALSPQIQELYRKGKYKEFRNLYYFSQGIAIISIVLFATWMPEIYKYLIRNEQLQQCSIIARYICFANAVLPLYLFMSAITFIEKQTKQLLWLVFIPGVLNIILCMTLIPFWGYKVAITTTMIAYWSQLIIPFFIKYHKIKTTIWLGSLYKLLILLGIIALSLITSTVSSNFSIEYKVLFSLLALTFTLLFLYKCSKLK